MLGKPPIHCNSCGATKGAANKWLTGVGNEDRTYLEFLIEAISEPVLNLRNRALKAKAEKRAQPFSPLVRCDWCSENCAHKDLSQTLTKQRGLHSGILKEVMDIEAETSA